jgi:hypothetical protein
MILGKQGAMMRFWSHNWWVVTFCLCTCFTYLQCVQNKNRVIQELTHKHKIMSEQLEFASSKTSDLRLRIASQEDPAWIEMVLMRDLGVVPEGFVKVHFKG